MRALSDCRVLIVDDAKANIDILVEGLKSEHKLSVALNGGQALQLSARTPPDLVLLDIVMPGMDGYEVCRRMRAMPETAEVPIMFLSSLEEVQDKTRGFEAGANDYLTKPFEMLEVKARVRSMLQAKAYNDAAKEQIASDLRIAREIQMGMLPSDFSAIEKECGVSIGAVLEPAREVGGDLYGICTSNPGRLVLFFGDVSGKGIPASLFMVRAITLARLLAREIMEPERILSRLNDELSTDNPSCMFVTFLCAVYEPGSGRLTVANGGHCRPILLPAGEAPRWAIEKNLGTALGFEPGFTFERTELTLREGDAFVVYSDGVTEAFDPQDECYGSARLLTDIAEFANQSAPDVAAQLLEKVRSHAGEAPQSDDIAILTLKVDGRAPVPQVTLELQATPQEVMRAVETLQIFARGQGISEPAVFGLALALEECASNVVNHSLRRDAGQTFQVTLELGKGIFAIGLNDPGPAFDPTQVEGRGKDDENPGGWGIQLVRHYVDEIRYARIAERNVLQLSKQLGASPPANDSSVHPINCN